jgi:methionine-rich copper-binding protein CopC
MRPAIDCSKIPSVLLVAFLILATGTAAAPAAGAHADLVDSCPGLGDRLQSLERVDLTFGERLLDDGKAKIDVLAISGEVLFEVGLTVMSEDGFTLSTEVLEPLPAGFYVVRVSATSIDGDESGADTGFQFEIDPDASPDSSTCDLPDAGGAGGWILLGVGAVMVAALLWFLRPTKKSSTDKASSGDGEADKPLD